DAIWKEYKEQLCLHDRVVEAYISSAFAAAVVHVAKQSSPSVDGVKLTPEQVETIAESLFHNQRVQAIKDLRAATGYGVGDALKFINKFPSGAAGYNQFRHAFGCYS
ncbi:MAG: hypothetical protein ACFFDI_29655, partial [Promethearchaeota archaeon]